mgnify:CR=1 FL=1
MTSTIFQQKQSSFSGIGVRMRVQIPQLIPGFTVMPAIEYWHNKTDLPDFGIETHRKDATLRRSPATISRTRDGSPTSAPASPSIFSPPR